MSKYVFKGSKIAVEGRITTGDYTNKEGKKVYTTEVMANRIEFLDSKKKEEPKEEPTFTECQEQFLPWNQ